MATIVIKVDGVNIQRHVMFAQTTFRAVADGQPGSAVLTIDDQEHQFSAADFRLGTTLELFIDGRREWDGWIFTVARTWPFPADDTTEPEGTPRFWRITGMDRNLLFSKRILYRQDDPADHRGLKIWPADTSDKVAIEYALRNYVDLSGDGIDITGGIKDTGSPGPFEEFTLGYVSGPMGVLFDDASKMTGAVFFIDPDRKIRYVSDTAVTAPFILSDTPSPNQVGYRELNAVLDFTQGATQAMVWGAGKGSADPVFAQYTNQSARDAYGLWQWGDLFLGAWKQQTVDRRAKTYIEGSPDHRRGHGDPVPVVTCTIFEPGLRIGDVVDFRADAYDYQQHLPVRQMTMSFPTPTDVRYDLEMTLRVDEPYSRFDLWPVPPNDISDPDPPDGPGPIPPINGEPTTIVTSVSEDLVLDHFGQLETVEWVHEYGDLDTDDWWYDGADMGFFEGDHGTFDHEPYDIFMQTNDFYMDAYYWFYIPDGKLPGSVEFRIRFTGGPFQRTGPIPYDQEAILGLLSWEAGKIDITEEVGINLVTGSGTASGGDPNHLYGYPWIGALPAPTSVFNYDTDPGDPQFHGPMIMNVWGKWLNVKLEWTEPHLFDIYIYTDDDPEDVKHMWYHLPVGSTHMPQAQAFGFQSFGLGHSSFQVDPSKHLLIDIEDIKVDLANWSMESGRATTIDTPGGSQPGIIPFGGLGVTPNPAQGGGFPGGNHYRHTPSIPEPEGMANYGVQRINLSTNLLESSVTDGKLRWKIKKNTTTSGTPAMNTNLVGPLTGLSVEGPEAPGHIYKAAESWGPWEGTSLGTNDGVLNLLIKWRMDSWINTGASTFPYAGFEIEWSTFVKDEAGAYHVSRQTVGIPYGSVGSLPVFYVLRNPGGLGPYDYASAHGEPDNTANYGPYMDPYHWILDDTKAVTDFYKQYESHVNEWAYTRIVWDATKKWTKRLPIWDDDPLIIPPKPDPPIVGTISVRSWLASEDEPNENFVSSMLYRLGGWGRDSEPYTADPGWDMDYPFTFYPVDLPGRDPLVESLHQSLNIYMFGRSSVQPSPGSAMSSPITWEIDEIRANGTTISTGSIGGVSDVWDIPQGTFSSEGASRYYTSYPYQRGTLVVYDQGTRLRAGIDYIETNPATGEFDLLIGKDISATMFVTYKRAGTTPTSGGFGIYRPAPVLQYGWGTEFDGYNCTMACSVMALDRHTLGRFTPFKGSPRSTPPEHRAQQGDQSKGTDLLDAQTAWDNGWDQELLVPGDVQWSHFAGIIGEGRGAIVQGIYGELPAKLRYSDTFTGGHAIYINERYANGLFWGCDPLYRYPVVYTTAELQAYTEAFAGNGMVSAAYTRITG